MAYKNCSVCGGEGTFDAGDNAQGESQYIDCPACKYRAQLTAARARIAVLEAALKTGIQNLGNLLDGGWIRGDSGPEHAQQTIDFMKAALAAAPQAAPGTDAVRDVAERLYLALGQYQRHNRIHNDDEAALYEFAEPIFVAARALGIGSKAEE